MLFEYLWTKYTGKPTQCYRLLQSHSPYTRLQKFKKNKKETELSRTTRTLEHTIDANERTNKRTQHEHVMTHGKKKDEKKNTAQRVFPFILIRMGWSFLQTYGVKRKYWEKTLTALFPLYFKCKNGLILFMAVCVRREYIFAFSARFTEFRTRLFVRLLVYSLSCSLLLNRSPISLSLSVCIHF